MKLDAQALAHQIKSILMLVVGFVLAILLAGTVARAAKLGISWGPSVSPMDIAALCVAWWALK